MFITQYDINFSEDKLICLHGKLVTDGVPELFGDYKYYFMKVYQGTQLTTPRQFLQEFYTYQDLYDWVNLNHPEQLQSLPTEEDL